MNKISDSKIHNDVGDFRLLDREVVEVARQMKEHSRFMKGILSWPGFKETILLFDQEERVHGKIKQNYKLLLELALNGIISFSVVPLRISTIMGMVVSCLSFFYGLYIILYTLIKGISVPGFSTIVTLVLFLGGVQLLSIGILGEYIARIFMEVKQRPLYVIETALE